MAEQTNVWRQRSGKDLQKTKTLRDRDDILRAIDDIEDDWRLKLGMRQRRYKDGAGIGSMTNTNANNDGES